MDSLMIDSGFVSALGWTILHSLWQAVILAAILWLASRALSSARRRYRLAYATLLTQLLVSFGTFSWLYEPLQTTTAPPSVLPVQAVFVAAEGSAGLAWNPTALLFWTVIFWAVGLLIGSVRLGLSFGRVRRMQSRVKRATPPAFHRKVKDLADRLSYHGRLNVGVSDLLDGPALIGHFKPILLFPLAVVNQLTPEEAEAVILHELAHLKRKDHWWNLLQCLIEVIFYYHPVVWWIGARIREEREHCCDDLVLRHGPDRLAYAKALLYFEENRTTPATAVALTNTPGGLLGRVQRFLHQQNLPYQMKSRLFLLPLFTLIALVTTAAYHPAAAERDIPEVIHPENVLSPLAPLPISAPAPAPKVPDLPAVTVQPDTLPQGRHQMKSFRNGKSTEFVVEGGAIQELKIDGETIPAAEYDQHEEMVERMLGGNQQLRPRFYNDPDAFNDGLRFFPGRSMEGLEKQFENMGEGWEELSERMGDLSERLGESFEGIFNLNSDGNSFHMEFHGPDGEPFFFNSDSLENSVPRGFYRFEVNPDNGFRRLYPDSENSREYDLEDLLREKERSLQDEEAELREMETMIEQLERRKAEKKRALEERRRQENGQEKVRELRGKVQNRSRDLLEIRRDQQQRQADLMKEQRERSEQLLRHSEQLRSELETSHKKQGIDYESVVDQLQEEGLLPAGKFRKLYFDNKTLKFNGTKVSQKAHQRCLDLIEKRYGRAELGESFRVKVSKH